MRVEVVTADGLTLVGERLEGEADRPPVLLLHGGGQTRHAWGPTARALADQGWTAIAMDLRGHGESGWGEYTGERFAGDVGAIAATRDTPPVLVGASLGGMSSLMALGADPPVRATGLVLVDIAHRFDRPGVERITSFMRSRVDGFTDPRQATAAVAEYLPHRPPPTDPSGIGRNLRKDGDRWRWHWDPDLFKGRLTERAEEGQARLQAVIERLDIPVTLVRGGISDVVTAEIAEEFLTLNPNAAVVEVPGAGHMVAGDSNDAFTAALLDFLTTRV